MSASGIVAAIKAELATHAEYAVPISTELDELLWAIANAVQAAEEGIPEAPSDSKAYGRYNATWVKVVREILTINGYPLTGNVTIAKGDVGLGNVDNISDMSKPISTLQQAAIDLKVPYTGAVSGVDLGAQTVHTTGEGSFGKDKIPVRNDSGSQINAFTVVKVSGDYSTTEIPKVTPVTSTSDKVIGVIIENLSTGATGLAVKRGRITCTSFNTSGSSIGAKVYCTAAGALTLTPTDLEIGQVLSLSGNGVVYFNIGGGGGGSAVVSGTHKRLGAMYIDGSTNAIDTNKSLYQVGAATYAKNVKIYISNLSASYNARIRVAHVDAAIASVAVEDYLLYDAWLEPLEIKIVEISGMVASDSILVRSSIIGVSFEACGEELSTDTYDKRVGALDIDGSTNAINTDKTVYTSDRATKISAIICNRNSGLAAVTQVSHVDSNNIANIADEDRKPIVLQPLESKSLDIDLNMSTAEIIAFRSDITNVNIVVYLVE